VRWFLDGGDDHPEIQILELVGPGWSRSHYEFARSCEDQGGNFAHYNTYPQYRQNKE